MADLSTILNERSIRESFAKIHAEYGGMLHDPDRAIFLEFGPDIETPCDVVVSRLSRPAVITSRELRRTFIYQTLLRDTGTSFSNAYESFCNAACMEIEIDRISAPLPILIFDSFYGFDLTGFIRNEIWSSDHGWKISFSGILPTGPDTVIGDTGPNSETIYATVYGRCTSAAMVEASREIKDIVSSVLKSFYLIHEYSAIQNLNKRISRKEDLQKDSEIGLADAIIKDEALSTLNILVGLRELLDAHFSVPTKKDSLARRVRNAVHFLVEADKQERHAVGLALSVVAMETLLCKDEANLATMLAENVAVLLEPAPTYRRNAVNFVKALYDKRSKVLHGTHTDFPINELKNARLVAAAVLKAFVERRIFQRRAGIDDETPDELINEMRDDKYTGRQTTGVELSPVVGLWRNRV